MGSVNISNTGTGAAVTVSSNGSALLLNGSPVGGGASAITISNKTAAYTVVAGDLGTIIDCTSGTFTVSLTDATTLGTGFNCWVWNTGTGTITIDPAGAETIEGNTTLVLRQGEGTRIVCSGTNWNTGDKKTMRSYADNRGTSNPPNVAGLNAVAISAQYQGVASASNALAVSGTASGTASLAIYGVASATNSAAIGQNSSNGTAQTALGAGAMALGGSYASGTDSFAAAIANNTSTYGATGANSIAMGNLAKANNFYAVSIGWANTAGNRSIAIGGNSSTAGDNSVCVGSWSSTISNAYSATLGGGKASDRNIQNVWVYGLVASPALGEVQYGKYLLYKQTTTNVATVLATNSGAVGATNQIVLPDNSIYTFEIKLSARENATGASLTRILLGSIRRGAGAGTTVIGSTTLAYTTTDAGAALWVIGLDADTTLGCLRVTVTGEAAKTIRWSCTVSTNELVG